MIRLFVGIDLPLEIKHALDGICYGVDGARWVDPETMHLTLRFIGDIPEPEADAVAEALDGVQEPAFELHVAGIGHFGSGDRVRVLWAGIEPQPALDQLRQRVVSALKRIDIPRAEPDFKPHITLARFDRGEAGDLEKFMVANGMLRLRPFTVDRFVLYSSHFGRSGPIYRPEAEYPLYGADWAEAWASP